MVVRLDQAHLDVASESRWLDIEAVDLVGQGRQIDDRAEPGSALRPAGQPELPGDRRAIVLEVDVDGHPRPDPAVPIEQDGGVHRQPDRRRDGGRADARGGEGRDQDAIRRPTMAARRTAARPTRRGGEVMLGAGWRTRTPWADRRDDRSMDASPPTKVASRWSRRWSAPAARSRSVRFLSYDERVP